MKEGVNTQLLTKKRYIMLICFIASLYPIYKLSMKAFVCAGLPTDIVIVPLTFIQLLRKLYLTFGTTCLLILALIFDHYIQKHLISDVKQKSDVLLKGKARFIGLVGLMGFSCFSSTLNFFGYKFYFFSLVTYITLFIITFIITYKKYGYVNGFTLGNLCVLSSQQIWELPINLAASATLPHPLFYLRYLQRHNGTIALSVIGITKSAFDKKIFGFLTVAVLLDLIWYYTYNTYLSPIGFLLRPIWAAIHIYLVSRF